MNSLRQILSFSSGISGFVQSSLRASVVAVQTCNLFTKQFINVNNVSILNQSVQNVNFDVQTRDYKAKTRLRKRCKHCFFVWRNGRIYVECKEHPRHKQHHKTSLLKGFDNIPNGYDPKTSHFF